MGLVMKNNLIYKIIFLFLLIQTIVYSDSYRFEDGQSIKVNILTKSGVMSKTAFLDKTDDGNFLLNDKNGNSINIEHVFGMEISNMDVISFCKDITSFGMPNPVDIINKVIFTYAKDAWTDYKAKAFVNYGDPVTSHVTGSMVKNLGVKQIWEKRNKYFFRIKLLRYEIKDPDRPTIKDKCLVIGVKPLDIRPKDLNVHLLRKVYLYFYFKFIFEDDEVVLFPCFKIPWNEFVGKSIFSKDKYLIKTPIKEAKINKYMNCKLEALVLISREKRNHGSNPPTIHESEADRWNLSKLGIHNDPNFLLGSFFINDAQDFRLPHTPYNLNSSATATKVKLEWEQTEPKSIKSYNIYRSTTNDFTASKKNLIGKAEKEKYIDKNVKLNTRYYYKILAIDKDNIKSNYSNEVSAKPTIKYYVEPTHPVPINTHTNEKIKLTGKVNTDDTLNIKDIKIQSSIAELDWKSQYFYSNENGKFGHIMYSPTVPGEYLLKYIATKDGYSGTKDVHLKINRKPGFGHNVSISDFQLENKGININENEVVSFNYKLNNNGRYDELGVLLSYKIFNDSNDSLLLEDTAVPDQIPTLIKNETKKINKTIDISSLPIGTYYIQVQTILVSSEDFKPADNILKFPIKIKKYRKHKGYKLSKYSLSKGNSITISGKKIEFTNCSDNSGDFLINNSSKHITEDYYFISEDQELIIYPTDFIKTSTDTTVILRAGGQNNYPTLERNDKVTYPGDSLKFEIKLPYSTNLKENYDVIMGSDKNIIKAWPKPELRFSDNDLYISYSIPKNSEAKKYDFWIKLKDNNYWWIKPIYFEAINRNRVDAKSFTVHNAKYDINIPGDKLIIESKLDNNLSYPHPRALDIELLKEDTIIQVISKEENIATNSNEETIRIPIHTVGIEPGNYKILGRYYCPQKSSVDTIGIISVNFFQSPMLKIVDINIPSKFKIGQSGNISAKVKCKENGELINDVNLTTEIMTPQNNTEQLEFDNSANGVYSLQYKTDLSGVYDFYISAKKYRFKSDLDTCFIKTEAPVYQSLFQDSVQLGNDVVYSLSTETIGNLNSASATINYNPEHLKFLYCVKGDLFYDDSNISLNYSNNGNEVISGIARLSRNKIGLSTYTREPIIHFVFRAINSGKSEIKLNSTKLFDAGTAYTIPTNFNTSKSNINIYENPCKIILKTQKQKENSNFDGTIYVSLSNPNNLYSMSSDLIFNNDVIDILSYEEGDFFKINKSIETSTMVNIDNSNGIVNFGVSLLKSDYGVSASYGKIIEFNYNLKKGGEINPTLENVKLKNPSMDVTYPSTIISNSLETRTKNTCICFNPCTSYVKKDSSFVISVDIDDAVDLYGVSIDVNYNHSDLKIENISEGDFLNSNGKINTSFNTSIDSSLGKIIIGLSRLGDVNPLTSESRRTLVKLKFKKINAGKSNLYLQNVTLLDNQGNENNNVSIYNGVIKEPDKYYAKLLSPPNDTTITLETINNYINFKWDRLNISNGDSVNYIIYFNGDLSTIKKDTLSSSYKIIPKESFLSIMDSFNTSSLTGTWNVKVYDSDSSSLSVNGPYKLTFSKKVKINDNKQSVPDKNILYNNYPNPFNPITTIKYGLTKRSHVEITIYDINGNLIETLINSNKNPGYHKATWNANNVPSGVYFYQIQTRNFTEVKKCILIK